MLAQRRGRERPRAAPAILGALFALAFASAPRAACIGDFADDFSGGSIPALYAPVGTCGSTSETDGALALAKGDDCTGATGVTTQSDVAEVCGDFDVMVDFDLGTFPAASASGGRFHAMKVYSVADDALLGGIEHHREVPNACVPYADSRKAYTGIPGCPPDAVYVPAGGTQAALRLRRAGTTLEAYHTDGGGWELVMTRDIPVGPVRVQLTSGTSGTLRTGHVATFDDLTIQSYAPPSAPIAALSVAALVILTVAFASAGATFLVRSEPPDADPGRPPLL